jgi:chemotaxis protein methyltransferase CheR
MADSEHDALTRLLTLLRELSGFDFSGYARPSLERRARALCRRRRLDSALELVRLLEREPLCADEVASELTVQVSELFRDPAHFLAFRRCVLPILATYPFVRVWSCGCANGEEAYSLAILFHEAGMSERVLIYATDLSEPAVARARRGVFPARQIARFAANYRAAGGGASLSDYYTAAYGQVAMHESLKRSIVFFQHDLLSDHVFAWMHAVFFRNVLIYLGRDLQRRAFEKIALALEPRGFLSIGESETLAQGVESSFQRLPGAPLYRSVSAPQRVSVTG